MDYESWAKEYESSIADVDSIINRLRGDKKVPIKDLDCAIRKKLKYYSFIRKELIDIRQHLLLRAKQ